MNRKKTKTIVLCSSANFYQQAIEVAQELRRLSFKVALPFTAEKMRKSGDFDVAKVKTWFKNPKDYAKKTWLTKHHFRKIIKGDLVLVLNYEKNGRPGYIGGAVLMEMAIALQFHRPIYILNPIDDSVSYKEEICAAQPIILNGDLRRIK